MGIKDKKPVEQVCVPNWMTLSIAAHANPHTRMADEVRKHDKTMGETRQGLESEREITQGAPLAQTWGECVSTAW